MNHWAEKYLGKPWVSGARGPHEFDCWGLLYFVKRNEFAQDIPEYPGVNARDFSLVRRLMTKGAESGDWSPLKEPSEGCAVGMSKLPSGLLHHVGIFTASDGGLVLHCAEGANVIAQSLSALKTSGFGRIEFFEYGNRR